MVATLTLFSGFGLGTLLLPTFSLFFPLEVAIAATAIVHLANNVFKVFLIGRAADLKTTLRFALPAAVAAALGAWLIARVGELSPLASYHLFGREFAIEPIKLLIGVLIAMFAGFELTPSLQKVSVPPQYLSLGGAISGFFGGLSGLQGALRSMFLLRAGLTKEQFIGTSVVSAIVVDFSRISIYGLSLLDQQLEDLSQQGVHYLVAAATLSAFVGSVLGAKLLKKTTLETVQKLVGTMLLALAAGLVGGWV